MKKFGAITTAIFLTLALTLAGRGFHSGMNALPDYQAGEASSEVLIVVEKGSTGSEIADLLFRNGVVKSAKLFFKVAVSDKNSARIAPGVHKIERKIPAKVALAELLDSARIEGIIMVRDGARLNEIVAEISKAGYSVNEIKQELKNTSLPAGFAGNSLEGFLYPANYSFAPNTPIKDVITEMVGTFIQKTSTIDFTSKVEQRSGLELLTIASLVQTEGTPDIFSKISRVIYNRLTARMALQFDSTVHYALNQRGEIALTNKDVAVKSRYNTYIYAGLPPGPIGSPTAQAIQAALHPAVGGWLYFITVKPGETRFTSSHDEFVTWKKEYKKNYRAGLFEKK